MSTKKKLKEEASRRQAEASPALMNWEIKPANETTESEVVLSFVDYPRPPGWQENAGKRMESIISFFRFSCQHSLANGLALLGRCRPVPRETPEQARQEDLIGKKRKLA